MRLCFTILLLITFSVAFGQMGKVNCLCAESQIKANPTPDTIFYLRNGTPISFCGYKFKDSQPTVYLKFVLAFCLPDTLLQIDVWDANKSCHIRIIGDTLFVDELDAPVTEKIYLNGLNIVRRKFSTKQYVVDKKEPLINIVASIFHRYIRRSESVESPGDKEAMQHALELLQVETSVKDLSLLLNVWMYYDPTDFSTRELIQPIFAKHPKKALAAIDHRLKAKKKWESKDSAPYADLLLLKEELMHQRP